MAVRHERGRKWAHPRAMIDEGARIGAGTRVWAFSHVMAGCRIGKDCNIGEHVYVESGAAIGDRVTLKNGVQVWNGVSLADDVFVGPNATFTNDLRPRSPRAAASGGRYETDRWKVSTHVLAGASIGANATIVCGVTIGRYAMVGAGAVVTVSVPDYAMVFGCPARVQGHVCACGSSLAVGSTAIACAECGRTYRRSRAGLLRSSGRGGARRR